MSGTFESLDVPPTLVSFAVTTGNENQIITNEFKAAGHTVCLVKPEYDDDGLPIAQSLKDVYATITELQRTGRAAAVSTVTSGGIAECVFKMAIGNGTGFAFDGSVNSDGIFAGLYGAFVVELSQGEPVGEVLGCTVTEQHIRLSLECVELARLQELYESKLENVYPTKAEAGGTVTACNFTAVNRPAPRIKTAKPRVLIPVFPGTNCEYDTAKAFKDAGADTEIFVIRNTTSSAIAKSVEDFSKAVGESQILFIPGGFSGGDEPDGSGKFITAFFRAVPVKEAVSRLLGDRDGLMGGICNGFQALVKLGLVPFGEITEPDVVSPTLTFNTIGRHQSKLVRVRVASNRSPWLAAVNPGDVFLVPISHGEGRFLAGGHLIASMAEKGQIATQYVDLDGNPTMDIAYNPNGSENAIEGITSPDGRIFGRMGHSERTGGLYKNVPGKYDMKIFESAVKYFK